MVSTVTDAKFRLTKKLEENAQELKEIKALLKKESNDRSARKPFTTSIDNYWWTHGKNISRNHTSEKCMYPRNRHTREATKNNNIRGLKLAQNGW
jgi:hypothetical protein